MFHLKNKSIKVFLHAIFLVAISFTLISCGGSSGGSSNTPTTSTLSGTAAVGIPIDGNIVVTDSLGSTANAVIDASGNYTVDVTGMTAPFIIAAVPTDSNLDTQYSFASQANITVNVTPLTTLTLFNANGQQDLSQLLSNWTTQFSTITQQAIDNAQDIINANLTSQLSAAGLDPASFDLFSSVFNADGNGFDGLLDSLEITFNPGSGFTIEIDGTPFTFDPNINIGGGVNTGDLGNITLAGDDTNAVGESFIPNLVVPFIGQTFGSASWNAGPGTSLVIAFTVNGTVATVNTVFLGLSSGTDIYAYFVGCNVPGADCSGISVDLGGNSITFTNASLPVGADDGSGSNIATAAMTVNGTLNWE